MYRTWEPKAVGWVSHLADCVLDGIAKSRSLLRTRLERIRLVLRSNRYQKIGRTTASTISVHATTFTTDAPYIRISVGTPHAIPLLHNVDPETLPSSIPFHCVTLSLQDFCTASPLLLDYHLIVAVHHFSAGPKLYSHTLSHVVTSPHRTPLRHVAYLCLVVSC
jgi:hypothetical protein